jgi:F0F1-type ATP synthase membrane subunit b/b'
MTLQKKSAFFAVIFAFVLGVASLAAAQPAPRPHGGSRPRPVPTAAMTASPPASHDVAAAHGEEGGGEVEHEHGLKDINWFDITNTKQPPYIAMLFNFALLIWIYIRFGKKPIQEGLESRREEIAKEIEEAQRMKKEAKARAKKYQALLAGLAEELEATKLGLIEAGRADKDRIVREAEEKAVRMRKDAVFMLDQEIRQMKVDLVKETVDVAVAAAEELLKKRITQADQERLADEFLMQLAARGKKSVMPPPQVPPTPSGPSTPPINHSIPPLAVTGGGQ